MHYRKSLSLILKSRSYLGAPCRINFPQNRSNSTNVQSVKALHIVGSTTNSPADSKLSSDIVGSSTNKDDTRELLDLLSAPSSGPSSTFLEIKQKLFGSSYSDIVAPQNEDDAELLANDILKSADFKPVREYTYFEELLNPVVWYQRLIESAHEHGGLGVGAAIFGSSLLFKLATVPLHVKAERHFTALHNTLKETAVLQRNFKAARWNDDKAGQKSTSREFLVFKRENGVPPQLTFLRMAVLNVSLLGIQLYSVNNMAQSNMLNMMNQKFAWLMHLGAPDPTQVLPLISAACFFAFFMDKTLRGYKVVVPHDKLYLNGMLFVNVGCTFTLYHACSTLPAATTLCLATNMVMSRLFSSLLKMAYVRNLLGLPELAVHSKTHIKTLEGSYMIPQSQADYERSVKKVEAVMAGQNNSPELRAEREEKRQYYTSRLQATHQRLAELRANLTNPSQAMKDYQAKLQASTNELKEQLLDAITNRKRATEAAPQPPTAGQNQAAKEMEADVSEKSKAINK